MNATRKDVMSMLDLFLVHGGGNASRAAALPQERAMLHMTTGRWCPAAQDMAALALAGMPPPTQHSSSYSAFAEPPTIRSILENSHYKKGVQHSEHAQLPTAGAAGAAAARRDSSPRDCTAGRRSAS